MANAVNYTVRLDADLRQEAERLFADLGMNLSTAMNVFLRKAVEVGGIPFEVRRSRPNAETLAAIREAHALIDDPTTRWHDSSEALFAELDK